MKTRAMNCWIRKTSTKAYKVYGLIIESCGMFIFSKNKMTSYLNTIEYLGRNVYRQRKIIKKEAWKYRKYENTLLTTYLSDIYMYHNHHKSFSFILTFYFILHCQGRRKMK